MKALSDKVPVAERRRILETVEKRSGSITVGELFPDFSRDSPEHKSPEHEYLRLLREAQFIRPVEGSTWRPEKRIEMKRFGAFMLQFGRDQILATNAA
jgi:hypothetical protein